MRFFAFVLAFALTPACFVADVGEDSVLACARNSDCPAPLSCNVFSARCVTTDDLTAPVPALDGDVVLEPAIGDYATTFRASFTLDGDVADDPSVVVTLNEREVRWQIDEAQTARDQHRFSFTFSPDTSMPEGRFAVRAGWISVDGVPAAAANLGDIVIAVADVVVDVDAPALVGAVVDPVVGDFGAVFSVVFALDGVVADDPVVFADVNGERAAFVIDEEGTDRALGAFRFVFAPDLATAEGTWPVRASWTATDGEVVADVLLGSFTLDGTSPIAEVSLEPRLVGRNGRARLSVVCDSPLAAPPVLELDDEEDPGFRLVQSSDTVFVYEFAVDCRSDGCLPRDGRYGVAAVNVVDGVGNARRVRLADAAVVVDTGAPRVVGLTTNRARFSEVDGFNDLVVGFSLDEAVDAGGVSAAVEALDLACDVDGRDVSCAGVVAEDVVAEGSPVVVVTVVDAAGNASVATRTIAVDYTAPTLVDGSSSLAIAPPSDDGLAHPGDTLVVALTAAETLTGAPAIEGFPDGTAIDVPSLDALAFTNTSFLGGRVGEYRHVLGAQAREGGYRVRATLVDLVGHSALVDVGVTFSFAAIVESQCPDLGCTDGDGDGQTGFSATCIAGPDCDDGDARVFVGAPELPGDGRDNGCRGVGDAPIDESVGIFVDAARGNAGAAGTRADPVDIILGTVDVAFVAVTGTRANVRGASVVIGGLDPDTWEPVDEKSLVTSASLRAAANVTADSVNFSGNQRGLVVDSTLNLTFSSVSNAVIVGTLMNEGTAADVALVDSTIRRVTFIGTSTLMRVDARDTKLGASGTPPNASLVPATVTATNSIITSDSNSAADLEVIAGSFIAVNSEFVTPTEPRFTPMIDVRGSLTIVNSVARVANGRPFMRRNTGALPTLRSLVLVANAPAVFDADLNAPLTALALTQFDAACQTCSGLSLVTNTRTADDVHILPDSPLVGAGVDPSSFSLQSSVDIDGDCRVAPFDVGRDELP